MKKLGCGLGILLAVLLIFIFGACALFMIGNNVVAKATLEDIKEIPLPEDTELVDEIYIADKLVGNGNGVQYFGAVLVKSELELYELDGYYNNYRENEWDYIVEAQYGREINVIEHGNYTFDKKISKGRHYIVYSWGDKNLVWGD